MNARGLTLTELLIAVAISAVVAAAGYVFYSSTYTFSVTHSRSAQMQRDLRIAADLLSRDIRGAAFGVIDPLTGQVLSGSSPIEAGNNLDPDPDGTANRLDHIILMGGYLPLGTLAAPASRGSTQITVSFSPGADPNSLNGQTFTLEGFYYGTATATGTPNVFSISPALNRDYTTLNSVVVIQTIKYGIEVPAPGAEPVLYRQVGAGPREVVATGIEDLQFAYLMADGTETWNPPVVVPPALPEIRAVRFSLLARSPDPSPSGTAISTRPLLEDHAAAAGPDRFHRRLVTKVVEVRNLGI